MAAANTTPVRETFPKATTSRKQTEAERNERLSRPNVVSSSISEEGDNWVLTTVIRVGATD